VFIIIAPTGLAFLPTATRATPQRLLATAWRLPLLARGVIEVIRFHGALQLPLHLVGQGGIAQPPTPAIARPRMHPQLPGNASRGTRQAQQNGRENPLEFIRLWYTGPPMKGGTTDGQSTVHRCADASHGVPGFHQLDPCRVSAACRAL